MILRDRNVGRELDLVVGTHALIQDDVRFARLGLVVIDEQHRFGAPAASDGLEQGPRAALPGL